MSDRPQAPVSISLGAVPDQSDPAAQAQFMVQAALASGAPRIYANSLGLALTGSDVMLTFWSNGSPVGILNLSFPTARSLVVELGNVLNDVESGIGRSIPTPREVQEGATRVQQERSNSTPNTGT